MASRITVQRLFSKLLNFAEIKIKFFLTRVLFKMSDKNAGAKILFKPTFFTPLMTYILECRVYKRISNI
jgi:hypothetical protein